MKRKVERQESSCFTKLSKQFVDEHDLILSVAG